MSPLRVPVALGVKVAVTVQLAPGASDAGQVLPVILKSPEFVPVTATLVIFRLPEGATLVTVVLMDELMPTVTVPKFRLAGLRPRAVPVPLRETVCGEPTALSVIDRMPLSWPIALGLKETSIVQLAPTASVAGHWLVLMKLPCTVTLEMVTAAFPVLVTVTVCEALIMPMGTTPKVRLLGATETVMPPFEPPLPSRMDAVFEDRLATARSSVPSRLKSPVASPAGADPTLESW